MKAWKIQMTEGERRWPIYNKRSRAMQGMLNNEYGDACPKFFAQHARRAVSRDQDAPTSIV